DRVRRGCARANYRRRTRATRRRGADRRTTARRSVANLVLAWARFASHLVPGAGSEAERTDRGNSALPHPLRLASLVLGGKGGRMSAPSEPTASARQRPRQAQAVLTVQRVERISPSLVRITAGGDGMAEYTDNHFTDRYVKLLFADPAHGLVPPYDMEGL